MITLLCLAGGGVVSHAQEAPKFPVVRFKVEGNTLLAQPDVDAALAPFIGPQRDFGDVQRALETLENLYRQRGFSTVGVQLPEQVLESGEVRFKVVEGRLNEIRVAGQLHFDEDNIRASLPSLQPGTAPRLEAISANLRVANENPAKKLTLQLRPGTREEDIDAEVRVVDEKPWKFAATLDNTGTSQTGKRRLGVSLQHANLWNRDHVLTFQYQTSPDKPSDVSVYALAYRLPLYALGDAVDFYAVDSSVNAGTLAAGPINLAISGQGTVWGGRYTHNLRRLGNYEQQLALGIDIKDFRNDIGVAGLQLGNEISVHPLSVHYGGRWQSGSSEVALQGSIAHNLPGGENGRQGDFDRARNGAPARFTVVRAGLTAQHAYASDWRVRLAGAAQWTGRPLVPQEQFGIGGAASVRGFQEREIADDRGFQATLEVYTPELCQSFGGGHRCRALGFVDSGAVYRLQPLPGEQRREHVASAGAGLRYSWDRHMALQADYGHVLQGGGGQERGDWRLHLRLGLFF